MNSHESRQWWIVATSRQIAKKPYKTTLFNQPLLIIRENNRLLCILDRCPHRGYPLSQGQIKKGTIQCAYHGWKFNLEGAVIDQPGSANFHTVPNCLTQFAVQESQGYVWVALEKPESDTPAPFDTLRYPHADYCNDIEAQRIDIMENFLDALHTHYVHSGIVRSKIKRHPCQVHIESIQNGYQATYIEEKQQTGALSRAFGGHIVKSIGRVLSPGYIQIDYCSQRDIEMRVGIWISPLSDTKNRLFMRTWLKKDKVPFILKHLLLYPILTFVFHQDKRVLEKLTLNLPDKEFKPIVTESDVMRHCINNVLSDTLEQVERSVRLEL